MKIECYFEHKVVQIWWNEQVYMLTAFCTTNYLYLDVLEGDLQQLFQLPLTEIVGLRQVYGFSKFLYPNSPSLAEVFCQHAFCILIQGNPRVKLQLL